MFADVLFIDFLCGDFHVDLIGEVLNDEWVFIKTEVFRCCSHECLFVADYFPVEGVDDGIGLFEEAVDSADLLEILFPFGGVFDDDSEVDVVVLSFDSAGYFFALHIMVDFT